MNQGFKSETLKNGYHSSCDVKGDEMSLYSELSHLSTTSEFYLYKVLISL